MPTNIVITTIETTPKRLTTNKFKYKAQITGDGQRLPGVKWCTYDIVRLWCTERFGISNASFRVNADAQWAWDSGNRAVYFNDSVAFTTFVLAKSKFEF